MSSTRVKPATAISSAVVTCTGLAVSISVRLIREPVTSIRSSPESFAAGVVSSASAAKVIWLVNAAAIAKAR